MREKVVASSCLFETRAIPLQIVAAIAAVFFFVWIGIYGLVFHLEYFQQSGLVIAGIFFVIFWGTLLCYGLINLIFYKMIIKEDGITLQTPTVRIFVRIFKFRPFPIYLSFDEIRIKPVWGGRILVFASGEKMKRIRRILLFGGIWVMPFRWKECIEVIKNFKPSSVTRA